MHRSQLPRAGAVAAILGATSALLLPGIAAAHEERDVAGTSMEVGFIDEPVFVGNRSGLEILVSTGETPVEGLETTLKATVTAQGQTRDLPISPRFGQTGTYQSYFIPTAAGQYSFHITGSISGTAVDETFTSGPSTFGDVEDSAAGQFPVALPAPADLAAQAKRGSDAAGQGTIAIALGALGLITGLAALGLTLARRRPRA